MSYASRFTSNRFAVLDDEAMPAGAAAPVPPVAIPTTRTWAADESGTAPRGTIFRRGNLNDVPVPSAFQGMRAGGGGVASDGFKQVGPRSSGYKSIFAKPAPAPVPKTYEEEFPSLGGKPTAAVAAAPKKAGFADLAKSWAKTTEEEAVATAENDKRVRAYRAEKERNEALYNSLIISRRTYISTEPEYDYNEEARHTYGQMGFDDEEAGCTSPYSSHTPPYPPTSIPGDYEESVDNEE